MTHEQHSWLPPRTLSPSESLLRRCILIADTGRQQSGFDGVWRQGGIVAESPGTTLSFLQPTSVGNGRQQGAK